MTSELLVTYLSEKTLLMVKCICVGSTIYFTKILFFSSLFFQMLKTDGPKLSSLSVKGRAQLKSLPMNSRALWAIKPKVKLFSHQLQYRILGLGGIIKTNQLFQSTNFSHVYKLPGGVLKCRFSLSGFGSEPVILNF